MTVIEDVENQEEQGDLAGRWVIASSSVLPEEILNGSGWQKTRVAANLIRGLENQGKIKS
jgi:cysteine synthase